MILYEKKIRYIIFLFKRRFWESCKRKMHFSLKPKWLVLFGIAWFYKGKRMICPGFISEDFDKIVRVNRRNYLVKYFFLTFNEINDYYFSILIGFTRLPTPLGKMHYYWKFFRNFLCNASLSWNFAIFYFNEESTTFPSFQKILRRL